MRRDPAKEVAPAASGRVREARPYVAPRGKSLSRRLPGESRGPLYRRDPDRVERAKGYKLRRDGKGGLTFRDTTFTARIAPDGTLRFKDKPNVKYTGLGASFDLTDAVMRANGEDPYRFEKARFARVTARLRLRMARRHKRKLLRRSLPALRRRLRRKLAKLPRSRLGQRRLRRLLFDWWDECAERRGARDKRLLARYGEQARALILVAIRCRLPAGSAFAYGRGELALLSRRRKSRQRFVPYGKRRKRACATWRGQPGQASTSTRRR
jgi:hypothetical protein